MQYLYSTTRGIATLNKGDSHKLVKLGKFKTEAEALTACKKHHAKATQAAQNLGVSVPQAFFI